MSEGSQRYCGNCGTEIRSGISFCVSCGKPVNGGAASPGPDNPVPPPTPFRSFADTLKETFQGLTGRFSNVRSASGGDTLRGLPNKAINWFKDLHGVPKLIVVGLVVLVLLVLLSPVAAIVAALLLGVSVIALIIRVAKKGSIKNWGMVTVASLVLMFTFGGISNALYGIGFVGSDESVPSGQYGGGETGTDTPSAGGGQDSSYDQPSAPPPAIPDSRQVSFTCEIFGQPQSFNYDGLSVVGQTVDYDGKRIMVILDPMEGGIMLGQPGEQVRVQGEYQGTVTTSSGGSYEAVMADSVERYD